MGIRVLADFSSKNSLLRLMTFPLDCAVLRDRMARVVVQLLGEPLALISR